MPMFLSMPSIEGFGSTLSAARAGAEWAWRVLYEETAPQLARFARACRVGDPEDLVGDVFLRAVRSLETFEGDERAFRAWMFAIARHAVVDDQRRGTRRRTEPVPADLIVELGPSGDAEQEALRSLAEDRVRSVIEGLTPDQRDVLLLRILGGLTIDEIAAVTEKRPGAVKALQARGIERIRRTYASEAVTL